MMRKLLVPLLLAPVAALAQPTTPPAPPGQPLHHPPAMPGGPFNPPVIGPNMQQNGPSEQDRQRAIAREKAIWGETCKTQQFVIANAYDQPDIINQLRNAKTDEEKKDIEARARQRMERQKQWYEQICASIKGQ